jgi:hypothetical protein
MSDFEWIPVADLPVRSDWYLVWVPDSEYWDEYYYRVGLRCWQDPDGNIDGDTLYSPPSHYAIVPSPE